ncbi:MAG: hypothetical protein WC602_06200, partial [archaeon]
TNAQCLMPIFFLADKWKCIYFHDAVFKDDYEPAFFEGLNVEEYFHGKGNNLNKRLKIFKELLGWEHYSYFGLFLG